MPSMTYKKKACLFINICSLTDRKMYGSEHQTLRFFIIISGLALLLLSTRTTGYPNFYLYIISFIDLKQLSRLRIYWSAAIQIHNESWTKKILCKINWKGNKPKAILAFAQAYCKPPSQLIYVTFLNKGIYLLIFLIPLHFETCSLDNRRQ